LEWHFSDGSVRCVAHAGNAAARSQKIRLTLPVISPSGERVICPQPDRVQISKPEGVVVIETNSPLRVQTEPGRRDFNLIPGFEAVTLSADVPGGETGRLECLISILPNAPVAI
jgi:hypothetical protein